MKPKYIFALLFASLAIGMGSTPIEDLLLQSDMDADNHSINNVNTLTASAVNVGTNAVATEAYVDASIAGLSPALDSRSATNDLDLAGFSIGSIGTISNGANGISFSGGVNLNPSFDTNAGLNINGTAGRRFLSIIGSSDIVRIGDHATFGVPATTNDVVLHGNVEVDGSMNLTSNAISAVSQIQFSGGDADQGILSWNSEEETLDLRENGTTLQLGQELHIHVRNATGSTISNGTVVAFAGTLGASNRILAEPYLADGNTDLHMILGVATEDILDSEDGKVAHFGKVRDINTSLFQDGDELYASATVAGGFTTNAPASPNQAVVIAFVVNSHSINGTIEVIPNWSDENATVSSAWIDEGDILRSTNDTVLIAGTDLDANQIQLIISNDVRGIVAGMDEDGHGFATGGFFNKEPNTSPDESGMQFASGFDTRFFTLGTEFMRFEASPLPYTVQFNDTKRDTDFYIYSDIASDVPFYLRGSDGHIGIHTNAPQAGLHVNTDMIVSGTLTVEEPTLDSHVATKKYVDDNSGGGGSDDLGNHTANTNLNMAGFAITNVSSVTATSMTVDTTPTATNDVANKAYVDAQAGGGSLPPREFSIPAISSPPFGGVSGSEAMPELMTFSTNGISLVYLGYDDTTPETGGGHFLSMPNNIDTNQNIDVTYTCWSDTTGDVVFAIGFEQGGMVGPTWQTNTISMVAGDTDPTTGWKTHTVSLDVDFADREHVRVWMKRVADAAGDTNAGDWNLVNTMIEVYRD